MSGRRDKINRRLGNQQPSVSESESRLTIAQIKQQYWSGPLPAPETLGRYETICPGSADRIIRMAESQSEHRQNLESTKLGGAQQAELVGQVFGFIIGMSAIGSSVWLITAGYPISGVVALLGSIGALAGVFVYGRHSQAKELQRKMQSVDSPQMELDLTKND